MKVTLNTNIASLKAQGTLGKVEKQLSSVFERLSTGLRINSATDDAAGLSMAETLALESEVFTQAVRNLNDGISATNLADSALDQLSRIITRQLELAEQAANSIYGFEQRKALDIEARGLTEEANRILELTRFNGTNLLDGTLDELTIQAGFGTEQAIGIAIGDELERDVGDGTTASSSTFNVGIYNQALDYGDINNDGYLDFAEAREGAFVDIMLGNGDGTFQAPSSIAIGSDNEDIILKDFNGDGNLDIAELASNVSTLNIAFGDGTGSFSGITPYVLGSEPRRMITGDFNGDTLADIAVFDWTDNTVSVLLNEGSGVFGAATIYNPGMATSIGAAANLNDDRFDDIIVHSYATGDVVSLVADGTGGFTMLASQSISGVAASFEVGDFNQDGLTDLVTGAATGGQVALGDGDGTFTNAEFLTYANFGYGDNITTADANGDGIDDVSIISDASSDLVTFLSNGDGTFNQQTPYSFVSATRPENLLGADFNGDGITDFVAAERTPPAGPGVGHIFLQNTSQESYFAYVSLLTAEDAQVAISTLKDALARVSRERGMLGGYQSRLQSATNHLREHTANLEIARGRIVDADIAAETAELVRLQLMQQASVAVLGQANLQTSIVLGLLEG